MCAGTFDLRAFDALRSMAPFIYVLLLPLSLRSYALTGVRVCRARRSLRSLPLPGASPQVGWLFGRGFAPTFAPPFGRASLPTVATARRLGVGASLLRSLRSLRRSAPTPHFFSADAPYGRYRTAVIPPPFGLHVALPRRALVEPPLVGGMTGVGARSRVRFAAPHDRTAKFQAQLYPNSKETPPTPPFGSLRSPLSLSAWSKKLLLMFLLSSLPPMLRS